MVATAVVPKRNRGKDMVSRLAKDVQFTYSRDAGSQYKRIFCFKHLMFWQKPRGLAFHHEISPSSCTETRRRRLSAITSEGGATP